ncbi:unnamed protein product, partial [Ostreobium quekettii]
YDESTSSWEDISPYKGFIEDVGNVDFCSLTFDRTGSPVMAYNHIRRASDRVAQWRDRGISFVKYNEMEERWDDVFTLTKDDLTGLPGDLYEGWSDGFRFTLDHQNNIYFYFKTFHFGEVTWPDYELYAKLWILAFNSDPFDGSYQFFSHPFDRLLGALQWSHELVGSEADWTQVHFTFDPSGIPYVAFLEQSRYRMTDFYYTDNVYFYNAVPAVWKYSSWD